MFLSKLEIQGFKSFAEKVTLEFNKELTAIVGPNGSGKSNITDAIRWVLGEQSLKLLRGKKSADVIFAGSKKKARLGFAEVSLFLDNSSGRAPLDYQEVVITRRIYRSGESEYIINKNKVRLTDIQLLLAKASFGQKTYSIIGQGMIDSILTSSPQERKDFFDEATGIREFQIKKDQALLKLDHSEENLGQSQQVLQEIEPRLKSLTRQVKKLERKEEINERLKNLQIKYYSRLLNDLSKEENNINEKLAKVELKKRELETEQLELQRNMEAVHIQDTEAEAFHKLQEEYSQKINEKNILLQELTIIKGKIDLELTKLGKTDLVWANTKKEELNNEYLATENQLKSNLDLLTKLKRQLEEKSNQQKNILNEYSQLQNEILNAQKELAKSDNFSLNKILSHLNDLYQKQQEFLEALDKINDLGQLKKLKVKAEEIAGEISWLTNKLSENDNNNSESIVKLQEKLNNFLTSKDSLVNEIQELKIRYETTKQKNEQLEDTLLKYKNDLKKISGQINGNESEDQINNEKQTLEKRIKLIEENLENLKKKLSNFSKDQEESRLSLLKAQRAIQDRQIQLNSQNNEANNFKIELAKIETKREELEKEITTNIKDDFKALEMSYEINLGETYAEISRLKNQLAIIGGIDDEVAAEYKEVKERHDFLNEQIIDLGKAIKSCHEIIDDLDKKIKVQFEISFEKINEKFMHFFKLLFNGGNAKLILQKNETREEEINEETEEEVVKSKKIEYGIEIQATPPGKKLKNLNMLSGGEKALTSIAIISAIMSNNPSPFVVLDEVDAALDEANSERFIKIIDELSDKTQFITITHNRATMHQASILYGVTMGDDGISKLLSINLTEAEKVAQ